MVTKPSSTPSTPTPSGKPHHPRPFGASNDPRLLWALLWDTAAACALAGIGRAAHSESLAISEVLLTALPFLAGVYITHLLVIRYFDPWAITTSGPLVWLGAWGVGMVGRLLMGQTNAPAFMGISAAFLLATMLGWRLVALFLERRHNKGR